MRIGSQCILNNHFKINIPQIAVPSEPITWINLLHWYSFDESSGDLLDLTGSYDGTLSTPTQGSEGKINTAYAFDGSSDVVNLSTGEVFDWADFTFAGWVKPGVASCGIWGGETNAPGIALWDNYRPRLMKEGGGGSGVAAISLTANTWNFFTMVRDGSSIRFGINGTYETETLDTQLSGEFNKIGDTAVYAHFSGSLDEFALFGDAKTDEYLTAMYNSGDGTEYADGDPLDDFESYSTSTTLGGQGKWINIEGTLTVNDASGDNIVNPTGGASVRSACYYNKSISANQYSEITLDQAGSVAAGCIVRASTTAATYYYWYATTSIGYLRRRVAGSDTDLDTNGSGVSSGQTMRLEVSGDELRCYIDDVLDTNIGTAGVYTDSDPAKLTSGYAGIIGYGNTTAVDIDDWHGNAV